MFKHSKNSMQLACAAIVVVLAASCGEQGGHSLITSATTSPTTPTYTTVTVTNKTPASDDIEVDLLKPVSVTFSDEVQASSVNASNITVVSSGTPISGTWTYDAASKTATFVPSSSYPGGAAITVNATAAVLKADGSPLTPAQWSFTTVSLADLIAYWRFDGDGTDYSGRNQTANGTNVTFDTTIVKQGSASALLNGTSSFFDVGTPNLGSQFTITVWVYMPDPIPVGIHTVLSNGMGGIQQNGFKIFINEFGTNNRKIATEAGDGTDGTLLVTAPNFVTSNSWKHLAVVVDKNAADPTQRALLYFNGVLTTQTVGAGSTLTAFPSVFATNQQTYLGKFPDNLHYFKGRMDDFRIYNRVLTPTQILKISQQN